MPVESTRLCWCPYISTLFPSNSRKKPLENEYTGGLGDLIEGEDRGSSPGICQSLDIAHNWCWLDTRTRMHERLTHQRFGVLGNPEVRGLDDDLGCAAS